MRQIVYVDMDNTIIELSKPWIQKLNKKYKRNVDPDKISAYKISDLYPDIPESDLYKPLITAAFWKQVEPVRGSQWGIKTLQDNGYDVYIVTSTDYRNVKFKIEYVIHRLFPSIDDKHVIITHNKRLLVGDFMVDDYEKNLRGGNYTKILLDHSYNQDVSDADIHRAFNWVDVIHIIDIIGGYKQCEMLTE